VELEFIDVSRWRKKIGEGECRRQVVEEVRKEPENEPK
jgi:hypothetical protein